jgi:hypothetical protein
MFSRIINCVTLICFVVCIQGCTSKYAIPKEQLEQKPEHKNLTIVTTDGDIHGFDIVSVHDGRIEGYVDDTTLVKISIEDVESVRVSKFDAAKTGWYTLGFLSFTFGLVVLIMALTWEGMFHD